MGNNYFDVDKEMSYYCDNEKPLVKIVHKPHRGKKVHQYTLDGKFVKEYESQVAASLAVCKWRTAVAKVIQGKRNTAYGFKWVSA